MRDLPRVFAKARPGPVALTRPEGVSAFTPADVHTRWNPGPRALTSGDNVITMYDIIGEDWWTGGGITAKKVASQLRAIGDRPVEVQINSPGGDMFEGLAIYNLLREHSQPVTVKVMALAASAASVIAMAGNTVEIAAAGFLMIHDCWVMAVGNRHDLAAVAAQLAPFDAAMADVYAQRSGTTAAECAAWMDAETWMNGSLAIERGFADALLPADQIADDGKGAEQARALNEVRATELLLVQSGLSRAQARERINRLKANEFGGTPGAAPADDTPGAVVTTGWDAAAFAAAASLLTTLRAA